MVKGDKRRKPRTKIQEVAQEWLGLSRQCKATYCFHHAAFFVLAKNNIAVLPRPLYSPNLVLCIFFFFPKLKIKLKGQRFDNDKQNLVESHACWTHSPKTIFRMHSVCGRSTGIGAWTPKGTTLKVMVANKIQVWCDYDDPGILCYINGTFR